MYSTLIAAADLAAHLDDPAWLIVDCRFDLARPSAGETAYAASHIPGAVYAHLDRDLAAPITPASGRHPLPAPEAFARTLGRWGLARETQVVAYDADTGAYAARLWWLLRWAGHRKVAVLDGGLKAWTSAGLPVTKEVRARASTQYTVTAERDRWLDASQVDASVRSGRWRLLDARAAERFAGEVEPIDPVAGHVPGAVNHPFALNLGGDGRFLSPAELRARFETSQAGIDDAHTIAMCGSGVTACHLLLGLEIAGKPGAKLYAGSWSEWIRDPSRAVAKGR
ncbi:MAG TPA: sulfurtransferase [Povalibacter sp.]|uniref:sulfurtransferase n=1 Tax=Povalibacter sp. TaxID=1962978 RepID=UPI002C023E71|nr:sulfurtransferase [Povalibacter sp.]HMN46773.1 sulfurtransferase [Povalibacter sp.]